MNGELTGAEVDKAVFAREGCSTQLAVGASVCGGEPDFFAVRLPGQALRAAVSATDRFLAARAVDNHHRAAIVTNIGMIDEGDQMAVG